MGDHKFGKFVWDENKEADNSAKHKVSFKEAVLAFNDPLRIIIKDEKHSETEERYFCIGCVGEKIATVRFTYRRKVIRIFGAAYWRKGKALYEKEKKKNS